MTDTKGLSAGTNSSEYVIKPFSETEATKAKELIIKEKVKNALIDSINKSIENAKKCVKEYSLPKFKQIFAQAGKDTTKLTLRYGSHSFYKGIVEVSNILCPKNTTSKNDEDNYKGKIKILEMLLANVNNEQWFASEYENYLTMRKKATKKAETTRNERKNKKNNVENKSK